MASRVEQHSNNAKPTSGQCTVLLEEARSLSSNDMKNIHAGMPCCVFTHVRSLWVAFSKHYAITLLLVLPFLALSINNNWIYTSLSSIDAWVYHGFFHDPIGYAEVFPGTYYGARLSWIIPGFLAYMLFPAIAANFVLHLAFYYLAVFSLFFTLQAALHRRIALVISVIGGSYSYFLLAIGWDYIDGAGIAYCLFSICMLTYAGLGQRWRSCLSLAGFACASMVFTNVFWGPFCLLFPVHFLVVNNNYGRKSLFSIVFYFVLGIIGCTLFYGLISRFLLHGEFLFFMPQFDYGLNNVNAQNPWKADIPKWLPQAYWLFFPALLLACCAVRLLILKKSPRVAGWTPFLKLFLYSYLIVASLMCFFDFWGLPRLQLFYYSSYMIPWMYLAAAALLTNFTAKLSSSNFALFMLALLASQLMPLGQYVRMHFIQSNGYSNPYLLWLAFALVTLFTLAPLLFASRYPQVLGNLSIVACILVLGVWNGRLSPFDAPIHFASSKDAFEAVQETIQYLRQVDPKHESLFWYNRDENVVYNGINSSFLFAYRIVGPKFPAIMGNPNEKLRSGRLITLLAKDMQTLKLAEEELRKHGWAARVISQKSIHQGGVLKFNIVLMELIPYMKTATGGLIPASELSYDKVIFGKHGEDLRDSMVVHVGATDPDNRPIAIEKDVLSFRPTKRGDYITTPLIGVQHSGSSDSIFRLTLLYDSLHEPLGNLTFKVQDKSGNKIADIYTASGVEASGKTLYIGYAKIPETIDSFNILFRSSDDKITYLPSGIVIEQASDPVSVAPSSRDRMHSSYSTALIYSEP